MAKQISGLSDTAGSDRRSPPRVNPDPASVYYMRMLDLSACWQEGKSRMRNPALSAGGLERVLRSLLSDGRILLAHWRAWVRFCSDHLGIDPDEPFRDLPGWKRVKFVATDPELEELSYSAEQLRHVAALAGTELPGLATEEGLLAELVENVVFEETGGSAIEINERFVRTPVGHQARREP